jgi:hypothetical protein
VVAEHHAIPGSTGPIGDGRPGCDAGTVGPGILESALRRANAAPKRDRIREADCSRGSDSGRYRGSDRDPYRGSKPDAYCGSDRDPNSNPNPNPNANPNPHPNSDPDADPDGLGARASSERVALGQRRRRCPGVIDDGR